MALDYSKLSDEELEAISNDDYTKLSDKTLRQLTRDPSAKEVAPTGPDLTPQALRTAAGAAAPVAQGAANTVGAMASDWLKLGKIAYENVTPNTVKEFVSSPIKNTAGLASAYAAGHPLAGQVMNSTMKDAVGAVGRGAGAVGRGLVAGATAPESLMLLPYQMAAYEQEKIQANPTAPEYATNPYAQAYRGEYPTQGAAGAANRRQAIANAPTGYTPSAQEAGNLLASNDERTINIYGGRKRLEEIVSSSVRGQAAQRIRPPAPGPVAPGQF